MKSDSLIILLLTLIAVVLPGNVLAYKISKTGGGLEIKWATSSVTYTVNTAGGPSGSLSAIQAALQTWNAVSESNFSFVYSGITSSTAYGVNDASNILLFGPLDAPGYESTLGLNTFWFYTTGQLIDSDIIFNTNYTWGTDGSAGVFDVQNIATHELGHSLSLDDLYDPGDSEKTMYGYGSAGETRKRSLHPDDINGISYLYPGTTICTSHASVGCYNGDVYWYDSCGVREEKKEDCECTSTVAEEPYCSSGSIYEDTCSYGCSGGACYSSAGSSKIEDCGETEYTTDNYCCGDNICRDKIIRSCADGSTAECNESAETPEIVKLCDIACEDGRCGSCVIERVTPESLNTMFWFFGTFCWNELFPAIVSVVISSSDPYFDNSKAVLVEHTGTTVLWQAPLGDDTVLAVLMVRNACFSANFDIYVGDCLGEDMFVLNGWMQ